MTNPIAEYQAMKLTKRRELIALRTDLLCPCGKMLLYLCVLDSHLDHFIAQDVLAEKGEC